MAKKIKRLINVTDLIEAINDELYMDESTKAAFRSIVYQQPLIDAVPVVHGRWIEVRGRYICSECKSRASLHSGGIGQNLSHYCPNCGAKMDGGVSDG